MQNKYNKNIKEKKPPPESGNLFSPFSFFRDNTVKLMLSFFSIFINQKKQLPPFLFASNLKI